MRKNRGGFTLVELIVVIAILGILAGIAIPVYSRYISRANKAADQVVLDAVNTAFQVACAENDLNPRTDFANGSLTLGAPNQIKTLSPEMGDSFQKYYGKNATEWKYYKNPESEIVFQNGVFVDAETAGSMSNPNAMSMAVTLGGNNYTLKYDKTAIQGIKSSSFYSYNEDGTANMGEWVGLVDGLTEGVSGGAAVAKLQKDANFQAYVGGAEAANNMTGDQVANALVGYAASKIAATNADQVLSAMQENGTGSLEAITKLISGKEKYSEATTAEKAAAASMIFALTSAYAHSEYGLDDNVNLGAAGDVSDSASFGSFMGTVDAENFKAYLDDPQAKKDVSAMISLMGTVNSNQDIVDYCQKNGYGDLTDIINSVLDSVPNS